MLGWAVEQSNYIRVAYVGDQTPLVVPSIENQAELHFAKEEEEEGGSEWTRRSHFLKVYMQYATHGVTSVPGGQGTQCAVRAAAVAFLDTTAPICHNLPPPFPLQCM